MTHKDNIIIAMETCLGNSVCQPCPYYDPNDLRCKNRLMSDALTIIKAQEPRAMSLEEVISARPGMVVWLEDFDKPDIIPALIDDVFIMTKTINFQLVQRTVIADFYDYGVRWRCWTSLPDDKRRAETPWE